MTVYYVLNQLGPHSKGDVLSFSPEQIGAGVDITHLTSIGAIRVASGGEIARAVPAQIQATHAPQGVGVFTNNGVPDRASYAGIAAYGSLCWNVATSPPAVYVNTGTIATPVWTASGGIPGVTSDGLTPGGMDIAGSVRELGATILPPALVGLTPDPSYNPMHTWVSGDIATADSFFGPGLAYFLTWTPTMSGVVLLNGPENTGPDATLDYYVYTGSVIGTDVPSLDGSGASPRYLADAFNYGGGGTGSAAFVAVAGQVYTVALNLAGTMVPTGSASLRNWVRATQVLGGQATVLPWTPPAVAHAEGRSAAWGTNAHAEGGSANFPNFAPTADNPTFATGRGAHAEGIGTAAIGDAAHAEGANDDNPQAATGTASHAEGMGTLASGLAAHSEGLDTTSTGQASHVEGHHNTANGDYSHAEGHHAVTSLPAEHAHACGNVDPTTTGPQQFSRFVPIHATADATPTKLLLDATSGTPFPLTLRSNDTWQVLVQVAASRHDTPGTAAGWLISGLVTSTGTPRIIGTPTVVGHWNDAAASGWLVALSIDVTDPANPALAITVTGQAAQTIYWIGTVHANRVGV